MLGFRQRLASIPDSDPQAIGDLWGDNTVHPSQEAYAMMGTFITRYLF
jgi:hypothetical protein